MYLACKVEHALDLGSHTMFVGRVIGMGIKDTLPANILEAGELVPMTYPPTARVAAYRRQADPDVEELKDWLMEMATTLKNACRIV